MRFFWKTVLANIVATLIMQAVIAFVLFILVVIVIRSLVGLAGTVHKETVHKNSVLVFDMDTAINDSPAHASPQIGLGLGGLSSNGSRIALYDLLDALNEAAKDDNITALYLSGSLNTENMASSYATLREVRQAIEKFKASGKKVYAYLADPTLRDYYLASTADEVALNPFGILTINGLASQSLFVRDALQKYGVGVQVTRVGKYKSATEMFTEDHMSDADREQLTGLLNDIWGTLAADMAASRKMDEVAFKKLTNEPGMFMAQDALDKKLVDKVAYLDEEITALEKVGAYDEDNDTFRQIQLSTYARHLAEKRDLAALGMFSTGPRIAVVYAEGEIVSGGNGAEDIGGDELAATLRQLRNDKDVKAVVLRVNSPGGSATASEVIGREMRNLRDAKIPVVVTMGAYAASGGYWISAFGDYIYAEPTTVTGSIGVFGLHFNFKDIANQHGLMFESITTSTYGDVETITRPWTGEEMKLVQTVVDFLYDQFIDKVSEGRHLNPNDVRAIAQGRVWSGTAAVAKDRGLVNALGGLGDAITKAEELADLKGKSYLLVQYPEKKPPLMELMQQIAGGGEPGPVAQFSPGSAHDPLSTTLKQVETQWHFLRSFNDPRGLYARIPYLLQF